MSLYPGSGRSFCPSGPHPFLAGFTKRVRVSAPGPQSPLPSPPPHPSPVALGAVVLKSCPLDPNLSQFPEKPLGFRSPPAPVLSLSSSDPYCSPGAGSQVATVPSWLPGPRSSGKIASRERRKTALDWTAELVEQITFQVPSGTASCLFHTSFGKSQLDLPRPR